MRFGKVSEAQDSNSGRLYVQHAAHETSGTDTI